MPTKKKGPQVTRDRKILESKKTYLAERETEMAKHREKAIEAIRTARGSFVLIRLEFEKKTDVDASGHSVSFCHAGSIGDAVNLAVAMREDGEKILQNFIGQVGPEDAQEALVALMEATR